MQFTKTELTITRGTQRKIFFTWLKDAAALEVLNGILLDCSCGCGEIV